MKKQSVFTRVLIIIGSILVWVPVLLPFVFSFRPLLGGGKFRLDYLIPAELALFCLAGGLLLVWAAIRAKTGRKLVIWSLAAAVFLLVFSQLLAVWLGLASGRVGEGTWQMVVVVALLVLYWAALALLGIAGIRLWGLLRKRELQGAV
ncbi:MAG: hypothetical protein GYA81_07855 [Chloroflexi bacterium]|nr:hypothetical protein [Chloroflexota bacterium]